MKKVIFYLLALVCMPIHALAQWTETVPSLLGQLSQTVGAMAYSSGVVWAGTSSLWSSTDQGVTWVKNPLSLSNIVAHIFFLDRNDGLVTTHEGNVYRTSDGGMTWDNVLSIGSATSACFLDNPDNILVSEFQPGTVHYSRDGGSTWNTSYNDTWIRQIIPSVNGKAYLLSGDWATGGHVWISSDYGASWSEQMAAVNADSYSFAIEQCNTKNIVVTNEGYSITAAYDGRSRLYASSDEGQTWNVTANYPTKYFAGYATEGPNTVFAQTVSQVNLGVVRSTDHGNTWTNIGGPSSTGDTRLIAAIDDNTIVAADVGGNIWVTHNSGGDSLTLLNYNGMAALTVAPINQQFSASSCKTEDTEIKLGIIGCSPAPGILDSTWISGSPAITINDEQTAPRTLALSDSISIQYSPSASGNDTAQLFIRYDLGSGALDTSITIVGSLGSTLLSGPVSLHREVGVSYFGSPDSLPMGVDINSSVNIDSIWPYLHDISCTYSFDSSVVVFLAYLPPNGWTLSSFLNHGNSVDFGIHNLSSTTPGQPVNLGTAVFLPAHPMLETSDVTLTNLIMDIGNQSVAPCIAEDEDQHWSVKVLVTDGVNASESASQANNLSIYPNPTENELFVQNPNLYPVSIAFYDVVGREVLSASVAEGSTASIDLESLAQGSYVMACHTGVGIIVRRIIKIK
jgi:photosystem II stability/assembly factor-like uncharacterized protein